MIMAEGLRIGVTGAAGYIGSRVAVALREQGHEVTPIDNFHDAKVGTIEGIPIQDVDIRDREALRTSLRGVDSVMHLAAITGVPECDDDPETAFDVNVGGTENVGWLCREWEVPLVFPASMAIIGNPVEFPITAGHPRNPLNLYGRTKRMSEDDVHALAEGAFQALVFMKSNLYGHHVVDGTVIGKRTVINIFVDRALQGKPLEVHEPGTQARDFIHVFDVGRAYVRALETLIDSGPGANTVPIASGESASVLEIAESVKRYAAAERGKHVDIEMIENPRAAETDAGDFTVDTETARDVIGFEADRTIDDTIREMIRE